MNVMMLVALLVVFCMGCAGGALLCFLFFSKRLRRLESSDNLLPRVARKDEEEKPSVIECLKEALLHHSPFGMLWCIVDAHKKIVLKHGDFARHAALASSSYALQLFRNTAVENCIAAALREGKPEYLWNVPFLEQHWDVHVIPWLHGGKWALENHAHKEEAFAIVACMPTTKDERESSDEMEEEFLQNVAHEIKNPLTSIIGFAELLHEDAQNAKLVERIQRQSKRLFSIVETMVFLTGRGCEESFAHVCIDDCIRQAMEQLEDVAQSKRIGMEYASCTSEALRVVGNATLLVTAFKNVLENAIEHSARGDVVSIETNVNTVVHAPHVVVRVSDRGSGIPAADREKVFDRFYRGNVGKSRARGGTGLGLAITKKVLELHGGRVFFKSEVDRGTTFTFSIPRTTGM